MMASRSKTTGVHVVDLLNYLNFTNVLISPGAKIENMYKFSSLSHLHFECGSLVSRMLSTLKQAVQTGFLLSWSDITLESLIKYKSPNHNILVQVDQMFKNF